MNKLIPGCIYSSGSNIFLFIGKIKGVLNKYGFFWLSSYRCEVNYAKTDDQYNDEYLVTDIFSGEFSCNDL